MALFASPTTSPRSCRPGLFCCVDSSCGCENPASIVRDPFTWPGTRPARLPLHKPRPPRYGRKTHTHQVASPAPPQATARHPSTVTTCHPTAPTRRPHARLLHTRMPNTPPRHRPMPPMHSRVRPVTPPPRQPLHHTRPPHLPHPGAHPRPLVQGMRTPTLHRRRPRTTRTLATHRTRLRSKRSKARPRFMFVVSLKQDSTNSKRLVKSKPRNLNLKSRTVNRELRPRASPRSHNKNFHKTFSKTFLPTLDRGEGV